MAVIGVDIGGSGIKAAPVDISKGVLLRDRVRVATPQPSTVDAVVDCVAEVVHEAEAGVRSVSRTIGVTFPGVVRDGQIRTAANVDKSWIGVDLSDLLQQRLGRTAVVLNDADAAGVAEARFGAARGVKGVVLTLTFGTGIGSALFVDGVLVPNTELGHLEWEGKDAEKRAAASVREAKGWSWKKWAGRASGYIAMLERLFSPDLIVIGGGVDKDATKWLPHLKTGVTCVPAALANNAGIVGAAASTRRARS